jgi:hypothetical protein
MSERKFFVNTVTLVVLTEDEPLGPETDLQNVCYMIDDGPAVGDALEISSAEVSPKEMASLLTKAGSEPGFFQLDYDGNTVEG